MSTLFILGNTNQHTFANSIVAADDKSQSLYGDSVKDIYVLHSPESHRFLTSRKGWRHHLAKNNIPSDIIIERQIDISLCPEKSLERFADYVRTAVMSFEPRQMIVDVSNGTVVYRNLLSTVAYILDIQHIYMIDITKLNKPAKNLRFLRAAELSDAYVKAPETKSFDSMAYLSLTEILRYRDIIELHTGNYAEIEPASSDAVFFRDNLLHSVQLKLQGDQSLGGDNAIYRIASSSIAASIEELARVIIERFIPEAPENKGQPTLGGRLTAISKRITEVAGNDFDLEFFRLFNAFMKYLRNSSVHKGRLLSKVERFKAELSVKMTFPFLEFYTDVVLPALASTSPVSSPVVKICRLDPKAIDPNETYFVGLDGDDTGLALEGLFLRSKDEGPLREFSERINSAIKAVCKRARNYDTRNLMIISAGDDVLFRGHVDGLLLSDLQHDYLKESVDYTCSVGYGKTLREAYLALKLAKTTPGKNDIVGVELKC